MVEKKPDSKGRPSAEVDVVTLKNIGPQSGKWLAAVGIRTKKDLEDLGAVNAFRPASRFFSTTTVFSPFLVFRSTIFDEHPDLLHLVGADSIARDATDAVRQANQWVLSSHLN